MYKICLKTQPLIKWAVNYASKFNKRSSIEKKVPEGIALEAAAEEIIYFNLIVCPLVS